MTRRRCLLFLACALLVLGPASIALALVGETTKQIESRYGPARNSNRDEFGNEQRAYTHAGYIVAVAFERGISVCESFFRDKSSRDFTPEELADILVAYVPSGTHWKASTTEAWVWNSADGKIRALHPSHRLQIATVSYAQRMAAYNDAKSKKKPK
jgi:hypothetical protein